MAANLGEKNISQSKEAFQKEHYTNNTLPWDRENKSFSVSSIRRSMRTKLRWTMLLGQQSRTSRSSADGRASWDMKTLISDMWLMFRVWGGEGKREGWWGRAQERWRKADLPKRAEDNVSTEVADSEPCRKSRRKRLGGRDLWVSSLPAQRSRNLKAKAKACLRVLAAMVTRSRLVLGLIIVLEQSLC